MVCAYQIDYALRSAACPLETAVTNTNLKETTPCSNAYVYSLSPR